MFDQTKFDSCVDWYYANRDSLQPLYRGKYVVCADWKLIGAWGNFSLAAANVVDMGYKPGDFAVQHCVPAEEEAHVSGIRLT